MLIPVIASILGISALLDVKEHSLTHYPIFSWSSGIGDEVTISRIVDMYQYLKSWNFDERILVDCVLWDDGDSNYPQDLFRCNFVYHAKTKNGLDKLLFFELDSVVERYFRIGGIVASPWIKCIGTTTLKNGIKRFVGEGKKEGWFSLRLSWLMHQYFGLERGIFYIQDPDSSSYSTWAMDDGIAVLNESPDGVDEYERIIYETGQMSKSLFLLSKEDFLKTIGIVP